jgi:hypothetical protein
VSKLGLALVIFLRAMDAQAFDLGGDCLAVSAGAMALNREMQALAAKKDWDAALDAGRRYLRDMCDNPYRWGQVLEVLLDSPRRAEALDFLWEMHMRGLDLNRASVDWEKVRGLDDFDESEIGEHYAASRRAIQAIQESARERIAYGITGSPSYWTDDVCPGEYCTLGTGMLLPITLEAFDRPGGNRVGSVPRCAKVNQLRTRYESPMVPHVVIFDHEDERCHRRVGDEPCGPFEKGDLVYYVIYEGEGFARVLHEDHEKILDGQHGLLGECAIPSSKCWLTALVPASRAQSVVDEQLWVLIETPDGSSHWVRDMALYNAYEDVDPDPAYVEAKRALEEECSAPPRAQKKTDTHGR